MQIIAAIFLGVIGAFFASALGAKRPTQKMVTLDDFDVPQIEDGTPQAVVFGDGWIEGWQVLWYGNYRTKKIKGKKKK